MKKRTFQELIDNGTTQPQPIGKGYEGLIKPCLIVNCCHNNYGRPVKVYKGKMEFFTRALWKIEHGDNSIGDKLVCHLCDVKACVEISHLKLGTYSENAFDKVRAGTSRRGIPATGKNAKGIPNIGKRAKGMPGTGKNAKGMPGTGLNAKGEKNASSILTEIQVLEMRQLRESGGWTYKKLSRKYRVHTDTIANIIRRKTWSHI